jgi:predicted membrane-bound spermidine synthase
LVSSRIRVTKPAQEQIALWPRALALGLVSASGIAFEITLTRTFSVLFQYHYVFLAVSLAILGLSFGAALVKLVGVEGERAAKALQRTLIALSLSFPLCAIALAILPSTVSIVMHVLVALVPFALAGAAMALIFMLRPQSSGVLYAADLVGAAAGIAAALALLGALGAFNVVIALGLVVAIAAFANSWQPGPLHLVAQNASRPLNLHAGMIAPGLCMVLAIAVMAVNGSTGLLDNSPSRVADAPPDKTMLAVLRDPSQGARVVYSAWDPFARVDVVETKDDSNKYVFTDGGAGSYMLRFDGDLRKLAGLRETLEFVPFADANAARTLILGAGAGKDVLLALLANSQSITAVEVNPSMIDATRRFADYNGRIFDQPQVKLHVGDARTFVQNSAERFDLIYLNLVYSQAAPPATQALAENYVFTREAFRAYLAHLAEGGRLAIITHNGIEGTRAAITAIAALNDLGVPLPQTLDHLALLMRNADDPTQRATVMILSKNALTSREIQTLSSASQALDLQPLHLPGEFELGFQPLKKGQSLERFLTIDQTYELFPTDDNRPFFYKLDPGVPAPISEAALFTAIFALLVAALLAGQTRGQSPALIGYLAAIGLGFMMIEIPLIQRFQLLLGYPTLSFALVVGTLLLSGGIGSWVSQHWPAAQLPRRVRIVAVAIAALGLLYAVALPPLLAQAVALPPFARAVMIVLLTAPLGLLMGMPFPSALRMAGQQPGNNIALLWGVNGAFSALGSTLAMLLAITAGFQWATLIGVAAYLALLPLTRATRA